MNTFFKSITTFVMFTLVMLQYTQAQDKTLYSGAWKADSYFTTFEGSWSIVERKGKTLLLISDDFKAKKAPDLKLFLSKLALDDIDGDNASDTNTSILISELSGYKGSAIYEIPELINLSDYQTILVHCKQYAKFWGGSSLK